MSSATENRKNFAAQVGAETSVIPIPTGYLNLPNPTSLQALIINPDMGCIGTLQKSRFWGVTARLLPKDWNEKCRM